MRVSKSTDKNDACPVSLIQRQFWVLHNFSPDSPAYNIPLVSVIKGDLNSDALETALNILLEKYRIFRAIFDLDNSGELIQRFARWQKRTMPRVDLRPSEESAVKKTTLEELLTEETQGPFNLATGPLMRFKLFRTEEHLHVLVITVHHIIFDLKTSKLFAEELSKAYSAALRGQTAVGSIETAEYAEFCEWQKSWIISDESKKMEASWKRYLEDSETSLEIPFDYTDKDASSQSGAIVPVRLSRNLVERIKTFCQKEAVVPFLALLTAWSLTLARASRQSKLTIGVPLTNRRKDEFKKTMGCFVNILPLVLDLSDNPTMSETLRQIRWGILKMHRMQETPYYNLVQMVRNSRTTRINSLFQAGFTFEPPMQLQLEGLSVKPRTIHHGGSQLDLFAKFWEEDDEITGLIEYDRNRFSPLAMENLAEDMVSIVDELCTMSQQDITTVLTEKGRNQSPPCP